MPSVDAGPRRIAVLAQGILLLFALLLDVTHAHNGEVHGDETAADTAAASATSTDTASTATAASSTSMSAMTDHSASHFILSNQVTVLFGGFTTGGAASFFGALVFTFALSISGQVIGTYKRQLERGCSKGCSCLTLCACSVLHGCHVGVDLFIMLIAMTFNVGLLLAIIAGSIVGHAVIMKRVYPVQGLFSCGRVGEHDRDSHSHVLDVGSKGEDLRPVSATAGFVDVNGSGGVGSGTEPPDPRPRRTPSASPSFSHCAH